MPGKLLQDVLGKSRTQRVLNAEDFILYGCVLSNVMRPEIAGRLEERINEQIEDAGFDKPADFVRYAARKELDRREVLDDE